MKKLPKILCALYVEVKFGNYCIDTKRMLCRGEGLKKATVPKST